MELVQRRYHCVQQPITQSVDAEGVVDLVLQRREKSPQRSLVDDEFDERLYGPLDDESCRVLHTSQHALGRDGVSFRTRGAYHETHDWLASVLHH